MVVKVSGEEVEVTVKRHRPNELEPYSEVELVPDPMDLCPQARVFDFTLSSTCWKYPAIPYTIIEINCSESKKYNSFSI